jgi:2-C-methyl-D-erythritol 2,4-cyclodiphosphate synthase
VKDKNKDADIRVGIGFDAHSFQDDRPLMLGGVHVPFGQGLRGHSDADVLVHAVMDALLGGAGLPDLGTQFPDTDERYGGISSMDLLSRVCGKLGALGFRPLQVDSVILAERPKLAPHIADMRKSLAAALDLPEEKVNVKATTTEGMGFTGRGEGIAVQAVALLLRE